MRATPEFSAQQHLDADGYLVVADEYPRNIGDVFEITSPCWDGRRSLGKIVVIGEATWEDAQRQLQRENHPRPYRRSRKFKYLYKVRAE